MTTLDADPSCAHCTAWRAEREAERLAQRDDWIECAACRLIHWPSDAGSAERHRIYCETMAPFESGAEE